MRLDVGEITNRNTHVSKLGYHYPIHIYNKQNYQLAQSQLEAVYGEPARNYHFFTHGARPLIRSLYENKGIPDRKWFAGTRQWKSDCKYDFWIVFRDERVRTMSLMLIQ